VKKAKTRKTTGRTGGDETMAEYDFGLARPNKHAARYATTIQRIDALSKAA
jgi:hypothetical protein